MSSPGLRWKEYVELGGALDFFLSVRLLVQPEAGDTVLDLGDFLILKGPMLSILCNPQFNDRDITCLWECIELGEDHDSTFHSSSGII